MSYRLRVVLVLLLCGPAAPAFAVQQAEVRTLSIRDGRVLIDGRAVDVRSLPATLPSDGLNVQFSVIGEALPILEIGGRRYRLEAHRLADLGAAAPAVTSGDVVFRGAAGRAARAETGAAPPARLPGGGGVVVTPSGTYNLRGDRLEEARGDGVTSAEIAFFAGDAAAVAEHSLRSAEELRARLLRSAPRLEFEDYLLDVQRQDRALYERLQQEHRLELRTLDLAARLRSLRTDERRSALEGRLRALLEEAFALKQENRRREIEQLEAQLETLRTRLHERERHQDLIIDRRLRALLGEHDGDGW